MKSAFLIPFILLPFTAVSQNIQTIAGGGPHNLQALQTALIQPNGVAVDAAGNIYVSVSSSQIWKIDTVGKVNVFAGSGQPLGPSGDGGPALNATLDSPGSLAFDTAGNLYVSDGKRVRKISTTGIISTVAGTGTGGFSGDGGPATSANINSSGEIAFDPAGNLYFADPSHNRIRVVSPAGTINTFAGNGTQSFLGDGGLATSASLSQPSGVAADSTGAVYIADTGNIRIRKVVNGVITTILGTGTAGYTGDGGPAFSAQTGPIYSIGVDRFDNLYILERYNVRVILANQPNITRFAGNPFAPGYAGDGGSPLNASFNFLFQIAFDSANVAYVADHNVVRKITSTTISTVAGTGSFDLVPEGTSATNVPLTSRSSGFTPDLIALDNAGSLLFTDSRVPSIRKVDLSIGTLSTPAGLSTIGSVSALAVHPNGDIYFVSGKTIGKTSRGVYTAVANTSNTAGFAGDGGPASAAQFNFYPDSSTMLAFAANGDLYVADAYNNRVRMISAQTGFITTIAGTGVYGSSNNGILATNAQLSFPNSLALDGAGHLFVADQNAVRRIDLRTGIIDTVASRLQVVNLDGSLSYLNINSDTGLFADQSSNVFISTGSRVVRYNSTNSSFITVAGNGTLGFSGDGGPATAAMVDSFSIAGDRNQNLYISDGSGRIRTAKIPSCFFTVSSAVIFKNSATTTGSVTINATDPSCPYSVSSDSPFVTITSAANGTGNGIVTFSLSANAGHNRTATVNIGGASFTLTQAGVAAQYNVGFFQPSGPTWALDANGDGTYNAGDKLYSFAGQPGSIAVVGDWNGDGRTKIGYYLNGFWALDYNGDGIFTSADKFYAFGGPDSSYIPVVGDWNGSGTTKIGYYRAGFWALDTNGDGTFNTGDAFYALGGNGPNEIPLVGDWNGDHRTKIGFYYNGGWVLDYNGNGTFDAADKYYGGFSYIAGDKPIVGDWSASGTTKIGVYRNGFWVLDYNGDGFYQNGVDKFYALGGNTGDTPIVADWNGDGRTKVGVYNSGFWTLDFNGTGAYDAGDRFLAYYGGTGSQPIIGRW